MGRHPDRRPPSAICPCEDLLYIQLPAGDLNRPWAAILTAVRHLLSLPVRTCSTYSFKRAASARPEHGRGSPPRKRGNEWDARRRGRGGRGHAPPVGGSLSRCL